MKLKFLCKSNGLKLNKIDEKSIPITLIAEGTVNKENLKVANIDINRVNEILKKAGSDKIKDVLILTLDTNGKVYFQLKNEHFKVFNIDYKKEAI